MKCFRQRTQVGAETPKRATVDGKLQAPGSTAPIGDWNLSMLTRLLKLELRTDMVFGLSQLYVALTNFHFQAQL